MSETSTTKAPSSEGDYIVEVGGIVEWINATLQKYSDKDWNYSRIKLIQIEVVSSECPYLLTCELMEVRTLKGRQALKDVQNEVAWGDHHSSELGILEIISLRVNKALLAVAGGNLY